MAVKHYVDDIPPSTGRVYKIETDGSMSKITDITEYEQTGTTFGAADVNTGCVLECNYAYQDHIHKLTTANVSSENIKFFATSAFFKGDTFTFNDLPMTAQTTDGMQLGTNFFAANTVVECRRRGNVLYFVSAASSVTDDITGMTYRIGVENGMLYIEEG